MNPKHQIPCANFENGFLADSVVISKYLCKINGSKLYPECAMKQAKIDEAIIDVTEPNFKFRYFSRYGPNVGAISKKLPWPFPMRDPWAIWALWPFGLFLSESFKIEPTWLQTLLPSTCKLHFRAYLAGVIEKSDEGIQECEQCLDRLGGFPTFRWLRAPPFENNFENLSKLN